MSIIQPKPYLYRVFRIDLSQGNIQDLRLPFAGEKIIYHWGTQTLEIKLNSPSNDAIKCRPKQEIEAPYSDFYVTATEREETVELLVMNPAGIGLGGGEVRVMTDTGHYDTIAQRGFIAREFHNCSNVINLYGYIILFNPDTSPALLLVDNVSGYTHDTYANGGSGEMWLERVGAALGSSRRAPHNKYLHDLTASNAIIYHGEQGPSYSVGNPLKQLRIDTILGTTRYWSWEDFRFTIVVPPGEGLAVVTEGSTWHLSVAFQYREHFIAGNY